MSRQSGYTLKADNETCTHARTAQTCAAYLVCEDKHITSPSVGSLKLVDGMDV